MTLLSPGLHALIRDWAAAHARWRALPATLEPPQAEALATVGQALDALRHHGPDRDWEAELRELPMSLETELRRWRFHSPDVEVDARHPSGLSFSQTWWVPFALWDDEVFQDRPQGTAPAIPALLDLARVELEQALSDVHRMATDTPSWRVGLDACAPLDTDLIGQRKLPEGDASSWTPEAVEPLQLRRNQKWLNAGLLPLTLRAASSTTLAWMGVWMADRLARIRHHRGLFGSPADLRSAAIESGLLRWDLWSRELLARVQRQGSSLVLTLTAARVNGVLVELRGLAQEERPNHPLVSWKGDVHLFNETGALDRALRAWLTLDNPAVQVHLRSVEESSVFSAAWAESFDASRHRLH